MKKVNGIKGLTEEEIKIRLKERNEKLSKLKETKKILEQRLDSLKNQKSLPGEKYKQNQKDIKSCEEKIKSIEEQIRVVEKEIKNLEKELDIINKNKKFPKGQK